MTTLEPLPVASPAQAITFEYLLARNNMDAAGLCVSLTQPGASLWPTITSSRSS